MTPWRTTQRCVVTSEDDMRYVCTLGPPLGLSALNLAEERLTFLETCRVPASCFYISKSPSLGRSVSPPWPPTVPSFSWPSLSSTSESANLCGDRVGILSGDSSLPPGCWVQPSSVPISSVTLNKWFNFQVSVCLICKIELLLVPGEE